MSSISKKTIVVAGGGFAGVAAARTIGKLLKKYRLTSRYRLLVISETDFHTYTPNLYLCASLPGKTVSTEALKRSVTLPYSDIFSGLPVEFFRARVVKMDVIKKDIHLETGSVIHADYLISALGSEPNYFGMSSIHRYSRSLKSFSDALTIRQEVTNLIAKSQRQFLRMVIVGGGPTGVELAAEVSLLCKKACSRKEIGTCTCHITLITGSSPALSQFGERVAVSASRRLEKLGVNLVTGDRVVSANEKDVVLSSGKNLPYDLLVWTGGVSPNSVVSRSGVLVDEKTKRALVTENLEAKVIGSLNTSGSVYVVGDSAGFKHPKTGRFVPMVARAAIMEGEVAGFNVVSDILFDEDKTDRLVTKVFTPWKYPYVAPIGGLYALGIFGRVVIPGFLAWVIKIFIEAAYFFSVLPVHKAFISWVSGVSLFFKRRVA